MCQCARAYRCRRFRDVTSYGKDHTSRQIFYGFRLHVRQCWQSNITHMFMALANVHEDEVASHLTAGTHGVLLGDCNYWLLSLKEALRNSGVLLLTPFRSAKYQPPPYYWSPVLGRVLYRIGTLFGQLVEPGGAKRVWAHDVWHLRNRLLRLVLMHMMALLFNLELGYTPLQLEASIA